MYTRQPGYIQIWEYISNTFKLVDYEVEGKKKMRARKGGRKLGIK